MRVSYIIQLTIIEQKILYQKIIKIINAVGTFRIAEMTAKQNPSTVFLLRYTLANDAKLQDV